MAKFVFKLEPVLDLRRRQERDKRAAVAAVEAERRETEHRLRALQDEIRQAKESWRSSIAGAVDPRAARQTAVASLHLQSRGQRLVLQLAGIHKRLETARTQLIEAARARRAVEILRERRLQEWRRKESRREDSIIDELGMIAAARRASLGGV